MKLCISSILVLFMIGHAMVSADERSPENTSTDGSPRAQRLRPSEQTDGERRPGQRRPGQSLGAFSPEQMVQRIMDEFDADGDEKLNADELQKMLMTMRERRGGGMQRRPGGQSRPTPGGSNSTPGGESPQRPPAAK